jgi:hypothetical protein
MLVWLLLCILLVYLRTPLRFFVYFFIFPNKIYYLSKKNLVLLCSLGLIYCVKVSWKGYGSDEDSWEPIQGLGYIQRTELSFSFFFFFFLKNQISCVLVYSICAWRYFTAMVYLTVIVGKL